MLSPIIANFAALLAASPWAAAPAVQPAPPRLPTVTIQPVGRPVNVRPWTPKPPERK